MSDDVINVGTAERDINRPQAITILLLKLGVFIVREVHVHKFGPFGWSLFGHAKLELRLYGRIRAVTKLMRQCELENLKVFSSIQ